MQYLIEGIGSSNGLFAPLYQVLECAYEQDCFSLSDTSYYPSVGAGCDLSVSVSDLPSEISFVIFPNPFSDYTIVYLDKPLHHATVTVENYLGQIFYQWNNFSGSSFNIERGKMKEGLYFLNIYQGNQRTMSRRILIMD